VVAEKALAFNNTAIECEVALRLTKALLPLRSTVRFLEDISSLEPNGCYLYYSAKVIFIESVQGKLMNIIANISHSILEDFSLDGFSIDIVRC
jgi:hypothetical protein